MTPFETAVAAAVLALMTGVLNLLGLLMKDRFDATRAREVEAAALARDERALAREERALDRAERLAAKVDENIKLTGEASVHAQSAYHEANQVNLKIAESNKVAGEASDKLSDLIKTRTEPLSSKERA